MNDPVGSVHFVHEREAAQSRRLGLSLAAAPMCGECFVVTESGVRSSPLTDVVSGYEQLRTAPMYSMLVDRAARVFARNMPTLGGSASRMVRATGRMRIAMAIFRRGAS